VGWVAARGRPDELRRRRAHHDRDAEVVELRVSVRAGVPALGPVAHDQVARRAGGGNGEGLGQRDGGKRGGTRLVRGARAHQVRETAGERRAVGGDRRGAVAGGGGGGGGRGRLAAGGLRGENPGAGGR